MASRPATADAKHKALTFLVALAIFSTAAYVVGLRARSSWASFAFMLSPGLAALVAGVVSKRKLSLIGWRPGPIKYLLAGWLIPMACAGATYGFAWLTGIGGVPSPTFIQRASFTLGLHEASATKVIVYAFGYLAVMGLLNPGALGEEMGWRGFLLPELDRWLGFRGAAIITGVVWALWHWPAVLWGGYNVGTPRPFALACLTAMVLAGSVIAAWLRLRSGSIWPCVIMHATHNALIQKFFDRITIEHAYTRYFTTEFGVGLAVSMGIVAAYLWARMRAREDVGRPAATPALATVAYSAV